MRRATAQQGNQDMPTDDSCIFCKIVAGEIPCFKLHEDDQTIAFMDINPAAEGHALAAVKGHWPTLHEIPGEALAAAIQTAQKVAGAVQAALAPDGINLVQANGPGAAQSVPHLHFHVLPRADGDDLKINWGHEAGDMEAIKASHEKILAKM